MTVATKGHVLYCEDNEDTRILMTMMLERAGFKVTYGASVKECAEKAESGEHFDLYLLDHSFPDASGLSLCEMLREHDQTTPILFCSGHALQEEKEAATRAGAQDYLIKPDDVPDVAAHVEKWINESRKGRQEITEDKNGL